MVVSIRAGEHWEITPAEAKQLSDAIAQVARHYPVVSSAKGADWAQLIIVLSVLVVPRAFTSWDRHMAQTGQQQPAISPAVAVPAAAAASPAPNGLQPPPGSASGAMWRPQTPGELDPIGMAGSHATS